MKLNFWQIVGVALLIVGLAWLIYNKTRGTADNRPSTTQPAQP